MKLKNLEELKEMLHGCIITGVEIQGGSSLTLTVETKNEQTHVVSFRYVPVPKMQGNMLSIDSAINITVEEPE